MFEILRRLLFKGRRRRRVYDHSVIICRIPSTMKRELEELVVFRNLDYTNGLTNRRVTQSDLIREALRSYIELQKVKEV